MAADLRRPSLGFKSRKVGLSTDYLEVRLSGSVVLGGNRSVRRDLGCSFVLENLWVTENFNPDLTLVNNF